MAKVYIDIVFDGIYSGNIANVKFLSYKPFLIYIKDDNISIVKIISGEFIKSKIFPEENKNQYIIDIDIIGLINENKIDVSDNMSTVESYGMQYFPFVSSSINFDFNIIFGDVLSISIDMPKSCRMIWFSDNIIINNDYKIEKQHSYGENSSRYIYINKNKEIFDIFQKNNITSLEYLKNITISNDDIVLYNNNVKIYAVIRLSGEKIGSLTFLLALYFLTSILAMVVVFDTKKVIYVSIIAYWVVMIKFFQSSNPPQARTIFTDIILIGVFLLTLFGVFLSFFNNEFNQILYILDITSLFNKEINGSTHVFGYISIISIFLISISYFFLIIYSDFIFSRNGKLPKTIEKFFYLRRKKSEEKNKNIFK